MPAKLKRDAPAQPVESPAPGELVGLCQPDWADERLRYLEQVVQVHLQPALAVLPYLDPLAVAQVQAEALGRLQTDVDQAIYDQAQAPAPFIGDYEQPRNSKRPVDLTRRFDSTQLTHKSHGRSSHRDYISHCFRWGFARRWIQRGDFVLDVGCGRTSPLAYELAMSASSFPALMVECDYDKVDPFRVQWLEQLADFDFTERWSECLELIPPSDLYERAFDVATCFEVIEHMRTADADRLLLGVHECLKKDGRSRLLLSTPVFNGRAAANHLHEWTIEELQATLEALGFHVYARYGTFASWNDLRRVITPEELALAEHLRGFYGDEVLACFLAPKYPDASRNNVWVVGRAEEHHT